MQDESHDARAQRLKEIFQGLFLLAQRKGASTASVGINDTAFAVSDNGPGWTARTFRRQFPVWDLSRRLHEIGCTEMQIESRSRRGGWTAGLSLAGIIFPQEEAVPWPAAVPTGVRRSSSMPAAATSWSTCEPPQPTWAAHAA